MTHLSLTRGVLTLILIMEEGCRHSGRHSFLVGLLATLLTNRRLRYFECLLFTSATFDNTSEYNIVIQLLKLFRNALVSYLLAIKSSLSSNRQVRFLNSLFCFPRQRAHTMLNSLFLFWPVLYSQGRVVQTLGESASIESLGAVNVKTMPARRHFIIYRVFYVRNPAQDLIPRFLISGP